MSKRFHGEATPFLRRNAPNEGKPDSLPFSDTLGNVEFEAGEMAEWLKAHAWKACLPQGNQGSNPCLSAILESMTYGNGSLVVNTKA